MFEYNLSKLYSMVSRYDLDCTVITYPSNIFYFTGLRGAGGSLLVLFEGEDPIILAPVLDYWRVVDCLGGSFRVLAYGFNPGAISSEVVVDDPIEFIAREVLSRKSRRTGLDLSFPTNQALRLKSRLEKSGVSVVDVGDEVWSARCIKSEWELKLITEALRLTEKAIEKAASEAVEGVSEKSLAALVEREIRAGGADGYAFETIVASGPNSSYPHHNPGDRRIRRGEPIVIDAGAVVGGYCSDATRTVFVGEIPREARRVLEAVSEAAEEALSEAASGVEAKTVDEAARRVLREYGLEKYFIHGVGHGVGVEVHEKPRLHPKSKDVLREGMVITIEPGVYVRGEFGVRIENMVLVKRSRGEKLNRTPNYFA